MFLVRSLLRISCPPFQEPPELPAQPRRATGLRQHRASPGGQAPKRWAPGVRHNPPLMPPPRRSFFCEIFSPPRVSCPPFQEPPELPAEPRRATGLRQHRASPGGQAPKRWAPGVRHNPPLMPPPRRSFFCEIFSPPRVSCPPFQEPPELPAEPTQPTQPHLHTPSCRKRGAPTRSIPPSHRRNSRCVTL